MLGFFGDPILEVTRSIIRWKNLKGQVRDVDRPAAKPSGNQNMTTQVRPQTVAQGPRRLIGIRVISDE